MAVAARRALQAAHRVLCASGYRAMSATAQAVSKEYGFVHHGKHREAIAAGMVEQDVGVIEGKKVEIFFTVEDKPGALNNTLSVFLKHGVNMSRIESKPTKTRSGYAEFRVDIEAKPDDAKVIALLGDLRKSSGKAEVVAPRVVPWFPTRITDIDAFSTKTLDAGAELESSHPGFSDAQYRERRRRIVHDASTYKHGQRIPTVSYTPQEIATWNVVYDKLRSYTRQFAVEQFNRLLPLFEKHCGYSPTNIPQLEDISTFLKSQTGFQIRPVGGLLSARDFLNALAFRVFFSTQYIRHHSVPLYTPEPDVCHELLGHAVMFADPDFADFSHEIGLASLGANDEDIKRLATCYWFSVEFGIAMQDGQRKAYGAGLLSSFGELEYSCAPYRPAGGETVFPEYRPWEPAKAAVQAYPITKYQPVYYVADSLADAKARMREFCETLQRGFNVTYDPPTESVSVDRAIIRGQYTVTLQTS